MSPEPQAIEQLGPRYRDLLRGSFIFLASLVVVRFLLEAAGTAHTLTRYFSSTAAIFLVAIYLAAVAPLRGVTKLVQLIIPAIVLAIWTQGWVILMTMLSGVFRLEWSHFARPEDYGNWAKLGGHLLGHLVETGVFAILVFVLMAIVFFLRRWPVTVGPGALLGGVLVVRFWVDAMGVELWRTAAWSSTVGVLISAFYLGGVGPLLGLTTPRHLFGPAMVLGWLWRIWVFLAVLLTAVVPFYTTHFFDRSEGRIVARLADFFLWGVLVEGLIAGLIVWGIASWIARATRPAQTT